MRVTSKGQVTIPLAIRKKLGILPQTEVAFELRGDSARLVKVPSNRSQARGAGIVASLKGKADVGMTTEQILALTRKPR